MKVKATGEFKRIGVFPVELGYIPNEGKEFDVTEERAKVLSGENIYHAKFIEVIKHEVKEVETAAKEEKTEKAVKPVRKTTKKSK